MLLKVTHKDEILVSKGESMKKTTSESFIKQSCFFYLKGNCSITSGLKKEINDKYKKKCSPIPACSLGIEVKEFVGRIKTPNGDLSEGTILSRYL